MASSVSPDSPAPSPLDSPPRAQRRPRHWLRAPCEASQQGAGRSSALLSRMDELSSRVPRRDPGSVSDSSRLASVPRREAGRAAPVTRPWQAEGAAREHCPRRGPAPLRRAELATAARSFAGSDDAVRARHPGNVCGTYRRAQPRQRADPRTRRPPPSPGARRPHHAAPAAPRVPARFARHLLQRPRPRQ